MTEYGDLRDLGDDYTFTRPLWERILQWARGRRIEYLRQRAIAASLRLSEVADNHAPDSVLQIHIADYNKKLAAFLAAKGEDE